MCIHAPALAPNAKRRVQCTSCLGHGTYIGRGQARSRCTSPTQDLTCRTCDGSGWLTEDEADAVPDTQRAED